MNKQNISKAVLNDLEKRFVFSDSSIAIDRNARTRGSFFEVEDIQTGAKKLLKVWARNNSQIDADIHEIWFNELRQVQRLLAYSGARDVIVATQELVESSSEIALVYDRVGAPLSSIRDRAGGSHWLRSLHAPRNRRIFWENLKRLVNAVGIIHAQGIIHGNITPYSVFTEGAGQPDFMLGGFEYSLSLQHSPPGSARQINRDEDDVPIVSFASDWSALGSLVLYCLDASFDGKGNIEENTNGERIDLTVTERQFITKLFSPSSAELLDAVSCARRIDDILTAVGSQTIGRKELILRFSLKSGLGPAVFDGSGERISIDDYKAQLEWVRSDFHQGVTLHVPAQFNPQTDQLTLVSDALVYRLSPHIDQSTAAPEWDIAVCTKVQTRKNLSLRGDETTHEVGDRVLLASRESHALEERIRLGELASDWSALAENNQHENRDETVRAISTTLRLLEGVDSLTAALNIHEVEIEELDTYSEPAIISLRAKRDRARDALAKKLRIETGAQAFQRWFSDDQRDAASTWQLSPSRSFGGRSKDDVWISFIESTEVRGQECYRFEIEGFLPADVEQLFLRPGDGIGSENVIKRRLKNLRSLLTRQDIAEFFSNPWRVVRRSNEELGADGEAHPAFVDLDASKQCTLRSVWAHTPMHFVVGPPGVGKTKLACEHIRITFERNPSSTLLVSAQGHDALDNLQSKITESTSAPGADSIMVVRAESKDNKSRSEYEPLAHTAALLTSFEDSQLFNEAPGSLQDMTRNLLSASKQPAHGDKNLTNDARLALGSMRDLVLDSAAVFVATTNSPDVERLVERRRQFDWAIVEEAAKATGSELLSPLILASRSLLIGDHRQLPPFDADRIKEILSDPTALTAALEAISEYVSPLFEEDELQTFEGLQSDPALMNLRAQEAQRILEFFRSVVEEDNERMLDGRRPYPLASELNEQRRMDPAIAELVSNTFYDGALKTHNSMRSKSNSPVVFSSAISPSPIIAINHPHISVSGTAEPHERPNKNWHSPVEAQSIKRFLGCIRSKGRKEKPTLAILSPYRAQVDLLQKAVSDWPTEQRKFLEDFKPVRADLGFFGTIDSFQGSEADIVILSLVRNNARTGKGAVGFLRDKRRLNVAISRAKHHLVIVGSLDFLSEAVRGVNPDGGPHDLSFLTDLVAGIRSLSLQVRDGLPLATILTPNQLGDVS